MKDIIMRATAENEQLRLFVSYNKASVDEACSLHNTTPVASAALGRMLVMASLMSTTLKNESDVITLQIKGNGPIGGIVAVTDNDSNIKGYVNNPYVDLPLNNIGKLDVSGAIGKGSLTVIKDLGLRTPYMGQIELISGEIAEDFTYYFTASEQVPSAVALGVLVDTDLHIKHAGGFLLQVMPECSEQVLSQVEKNLSNITSITRLYDAGNTPKDIIGLIFSNLDYNLVETRDTQFKCHCTRELVEDALITLGPKDIKDILETDKQAELHCHFCNKNYMFSENDLKGILNKYS